MKKISTKLLLGNLKEVLEDLNKAQTEYNANPTPENEEKLLSLQERGMAIENRLEFLSQNEEYASIRDYQPK